MPATLDGPPPYTPRVPASSNCQTFQATDLFVAPSTVSFCFTQNFLIVLSSSFLILISLFQTSGTATATGAGQSGSGNSGAGGSGATSTSTSANSSALSSMSVPPAFYALGLGIMAGMALVF